MKALLQRVKEASVSVGGEVVGRISRGMVVLVGIAAGDEESDADYLVEKIINLRIFSDDDNKFNLSLLQVKGELLVISQFTLLADARKGRRPSFTDAATPDVAKGYYEYFVKRLKESGLKVATGIFAAHMLVNILNDGPVTIMLDSRESSK